LIQKIKAKVFKGKIDPQRLAKVTLEYFLFNFNYDVSGRFESREFKFLRRVSELARHQKIQIYGDVMYELLGELIEEETFVQLVKHAITKMKKDLGDTYFEQVANQSGPKAPLKSQLTPENPNKRKKMK
jgi:hypothetical protein